MAREAINRRGEIHRIEGEKEPVSFVKFPIRQYYKGIAICVAAKHLTKGRESTQKLILRRDMEKFFYNTKDLTCIVLNFLCTAFELTNFLYALDVNIAASNPLQSVNAIHFQERLN